MKDGLIVGPFAHYLGDGTMFFSGELDELGQLMGELRVAWRGDPMPRLTMQFRGGVPDGEQVLYHPASEYVDANTERRSFRNGQRVGQLLITKLDGNEVSSPQPHGGPALSPSPAVVIRREHLRAGPTGDKRQQAIVYQSRRYGLDLTVDEQGWFDVVWVWNESPWRHVRVRWEDQKAHVDLYDDDGNLEESLAE